MLSRHAAGTRTLPHKATQTTAEKIEQRANTPFRIEALKPPKTKSANGSSVIRMVWLTLNMAIQSVAPSARVTPSFSSPGPIRNSLLLIRDRAIYFAAGAACNRATAKSKAFIAANQLRPHTTILVCPHRALISSCCSPFCFHITIASYGVVFQYFAPEPS